MEGTARWDSLPAGAHSVQRGIHPRDESLQVGPRAYLQNIVPPESWRQMPPPSFPTRCLWEQKSAHMPSPQDRPPRPGFVGSATSAAIRWPLAPQVRCAPKQKGAALYFLLLHSEFANPLSQDHVRAGPLASARFALPPALMPGYCQSIWLSALLQSGSQCLRASVNRIPDDPGDRKASIQGSFQHAPRQLWLRREAHSFWDMSFVATFLVLCPAFGQRQFAIQQRVSTWTRVSRETHQSDSFQCAQPSHCIVAELPLICLPF